MKEYRFTCPDCGCHALEELMDKVVVTSDVNSITKTKDTVVLTYSGHSNAAGYVIRYQCANCGHALMQDHEFVTNGTQLLRWLETHEKPQAPDATTDL